MKRVFVSALIVLLGAGLVNAQENPEVLQFARTEHNPRNLALAGAGAASVQSTAYTGFRAAATLPLMPGSMDAGASFQLWQPGNPVNKSTGFNLGAAGRIGHWGLSLGATSQTGVQLASFAPSQLLIAGGVAYGIGNNWGIGVNARYAQDEIAQDISLGGFSLDITAASRIGEELIALAGVCMLGPKVQGSADSYPQPAHALAAAAWHKQLAPEHSLEALLDAEYYFSGAFAASAGVEYAYDNLVFARAGYRLGSPAYPSHAAVGLGLQFQGFRMDAAYILASDSLSGGLSVGLGYKF